MLWIIPSVGRLLWVSKLRSAAANIDEQAFGLGRALVCIPGHQGLFD